MQDLAAAPVYSVHARRAQGATGATPFHRWILPDGTLWTEFFRDGAHYLLRFPDLADFTVTDEGTAVAAHPAPGVSPQTIEHLYLNQVLPLALSRRRKLILHASAVEVDDFAIAFLGVSGRGKSTLAACFCTSGYRFLTDDGLQLERRGNTYLVQPSHASIRLWDDSRDALIPRSTTAAAAVDYTPKARLLADDALRYCDAARVLRRIYFLGDGNTNTVQIEPVSGRDAMVGLVRNSFLLDIEEREMLAQHFEQLAEMATNPMFFRLDYPRKFETLAAVCDAVISHAGAQRD